MSHFERLLMPAADADDESITAFLRRLLPDFYFVNTPRSRMRHHVELLRALPEKPLQIEFNRPPGAQFTELMLCAHDADQPGLLARVAGALAALKINVHTAWIHTLRDPHRRDDDNFASAEIVLNTLILSERHFRRTRPLLHKTQETIARSLREILAAPAASPAHAPLRMTMAPLQIRELEASAAGRYSLLKVSAPNEAGVLFRVAQAVAQLNLNIAHAQINTFDNAIADTFFVTDATHQPLELDQIAPTAARLRALLET